MINHERDNLFLRTNTLIVWGVLALQEITFHSSKVFDVLDDWIVVSVKTENELCQKAVREIRALVSKKKAQIDTVLIGTYDLASQINMIAFEEGPPIYLKDYQPKFTSADRRIEIDTL
jgi:hypothetical protein